MEQPAGLIANVMGAIMSWSILRNEEKITCIIEYLISNQTDIKVRIEEVESDYNSRFIQVLPAAEHEDGCLTKDGRLELIIEKLAPDIGNSLIQQFPDTSIEFLINKYSCRFYAKYHSISTIYPHYGLMIGFPTFMEIEEKREDERLPITSPESTSAIFGLVGDYRKARLFKLNIINHSSHGLGLLVTKKDFDLLQTLNPGDKLPEITLFSTITRMNGTVKHKTKIEDGKYKGNYIIGLESDSIIESLN